MSKRERFNLSGDSKELLRLALAAERKAFLHRLHIYLALAGVLVGIARLSNQFNIHALSFLVGWPTRIIWLVGGGICAYALYLLLHQRSREFMARSVSPETQQALLSHSGSPRLELPSQISSLKVADLFHLYTGQA